MARMMENTRAMNPIQYQASQLWDNLSDKSTAKTYKCALIKTGDLLKQTAILLLMLVLLLVAVFVWMWNVGYRSGWGFRKWMESENPSPQELVAAVFNFLTQPIILAFNWTQNQLETQFGWKFPLPSSEKLLTPKDGESDGGMG
jgi:hypothetical protein